MFHYKKLAAVFFLSIISANCLANDLFDLLKGMSDADKKQNYQGTFVLRKSDKLATMSVAHGVDDKGVWERIESLNGEEKKILRHENRIVSVYPGRKLVTVRQTEKPESLHLQLPENIDQLEDYYSLTRLEDDRIANHQAFVVDLLPRDKYRYGYRYWIDKNTGMLLRCDLVSEKQQIIEQMMFTSLNYLPSKSPHGFDLQQFERFDQQVMTVPEVENESDYQADWKVQLLPKGFMLTQNTMRYLQSSAAKAVNVKATSGAPSLQHLVYSDGLASVSVFIEINKGEGKHLQGASSMGAVNAFGFPKDEYFVTVVGEVPEKTVQIMAQSTIKMP